MIGNFLESATHGYEIGVVSLDEHTVVPCLICDRTDLGARLTLLDASPVPTEFLLGMPDEDDARLCKVIWRTPEVIGAWFDGEAPGNPVGRARAHSA